MNQTSINEKYVLLLSGPVTIFYMDKKRNVSTIHSARKFKNAINAIDYMICNKLIDDYELKKIGDLNV